MTIDSLYTDIDKSNYYIGRISQVYRDNSIAQVENLSLLSHRKMYGESLIPNTINYLVLIDSVQGLFLGEVFQTKVASSENIHVSILVRHTLKIFCVLKFILYPLRIELFLESLCLHHH